MKLKIISWNVNGIRAIDKKVDLINFYQNINHIYSMLIRNKLSCPSTETGTIKKKVKDYKYQYWSTCSQKIIVEHPYGVRKPLNITYGINKKELDNEGRVLTLEFKKFYLINVYTPNSGEQLKRLDYRVKMGPCF